LRNPRDDGWPRRGERTEDEDTARKWVWDYLEYYRDGIRRNQRGLGPRPRKLSEAGAEYVEHRRTVMAFNTASADHSAISQLLDWFGENASTANLTVTELQKMVNARIRQGYSANTVQTWVRLWSTFFKWMGQDPPTKHLDLPASQNAEVHAWSDEEVALLYKAAARLQKQPHWPDPALTLSLFLDSGLRQQEAFAAEWQNIRPATDSMRVVYQLDRKTGRRTLLKGKLPGTTLLLPGWKRWYQKGATGLILGRPDGKPLLHKPQINLIDGILEKAGLKRPQVGYHSLRHTYARRFLEMDGTLEQLQKFLRHSSITTTQNDYGHYSESAAIERARKRLYRRA
jgi:site-specific recombinase XerD